MRSRVRRRFATTPAKKAQLVPVRPALWYGRAVGGGSLHYTANYWRFREIDFIERSVLGAIPGTGFDDWPITYADLEPYYTKVDWEIGVSGLAGASPPSHRARSPIRCRRSRRSRPA
jgi:choline dehydrogenase-like flavoprotein